MNKMNFNNKVHWILNVSNVISENKYLSIHGIKCNCVIYLEVITTYFLIMYIFIMMK